MEKLDALQQIFSGQYTTKDVQDAGDKIETSIFNEGTNEEEISAVLAEAVASDELKTLLEYFEDKNINLANDLVEETDKAEEKVYISTLFETIDKDIENFNEKELAQKLYDAINKNNDEIDNATINNILGNSSYSNEEINSIINTYEEEYQISLNENIQIKTEGFYETLLVDRLGAASAEYEETSERVETYSYNSNNSYNKKAKEETKNDVPLKDDDGKVIGSANTTTTYNKNNDLLTETSENYDEHGIYTGKTCVEYSYDENGNIREQKSVSYDENGNETITIIQKLDKNGNITQEYRKVVESDGTISEKATELKYDDKDNPTLCTKMEEVTRRTDSNGELVYEVRTKGDLLSALKETYPDSKKLQKAKDLEKALEICTKEGLDISSDAVYNSMTNLIANKEGDVTELSPELINTIGTELNAKLDLMVINDGGKAELQERLNNAIQNNDYSEILAVYNEVNEALYPKDSHKVFSKEIMQMEEAKKYYQEQDAELVAESFEIREDFDPNTMTPETDGEILLSQMYELKEQYELYKDNMGQLDKLVSMLNIFGLGTSEYEVNKMFDMYEQELKNLSNLKGEEFTAKFKALTGDDYSEETLIEIRTAEMICGKIDLKTEEELLVEAEKLGISKSDAYISDYSKPIYSSDGNMIIGYEKVYSSDALRTLVKSNYTEHIAADNATPGKAIDDYKQTVNDHRDFVIDFARTTAVAAISATGVGALGCGLVGAGVEFMGKMLNGDAVGEQKITPEEIFNSAVSGFISGMFQGGAKNMLGKININQYNAGQILDHLGVKRGNLLTDKVVYKWIELLGVKGIASGAIKNASNFILDNNKDIEKWLSGEMNAQEEEQFFNNFLEEVESGAINGAVTGVILSLFETLNIHQGKKLRSFVHDKASQAIKGEIDTVFEEIMAKIANAAGKTASRSISKALQGGNVDIEDILETGFKEIAKNAFK